MDSQSPFPAVIWARIPPEAQAYIRALESRVTALATTIQQLREQVQQNARTSSRPPSSDPPQALSQRPRREPTGRRPGGQPGHAGQARALVPVEEVDVVVPVKPERCHHCQPWLQGEDPQPQRHQVTEIPPMKPVVTEYQWHRLVCPACGEETRAEVPAGVPTGGFGPRVQAITALCTGAYHLSKRTTQRALEDMFGVQMGLRTIAPLEHATGQAVAEPVAAARAYVQRQPVAYLDETGWREGPQRAWLWTAVTEWVTVFVVCASRGGQVAQELLGERFWGWLVTDCWSAYTWYPTWRRQVCWAHLLRMWRRFQLRDGPSARVGGMLEVYTDYLLHRWRKCRSISVIFTTGWKLARNWITKPRQPPVGACCATSRYCGRLPVTPMSARPTMPWSAPCATGSSGASCVTARLLNGAVALSSGSSRHGQLGPPLLLELPLPVD